MEFSHDGKVQPWNGETFCQNARCVPSKDILQLSMNEGAHAQGLYEPEVLAARLSVGGLDRPSAGSSHIIKAALSFTGSCSPCGGKTHQYMTQTEENLVQQSRRTIVEEK